MSSDAMAPTLQAGDAVAIDTRLHELDWPGLYALWEGDAIVLRRLERLPASRPPNVRVIADNAHHRSYVVAAADLRILGRVTWFARPL